MGVFAVGLPSFFAHLPRVHKGCSLFAAHWNIADEVVEFPSGVSCPPSDKPTQPNTSTSPLRFGVCRSGQSLTQTTTKLCTPIHDQIHEKVLDEEVVFSALSSWSSPPASRHSQASPLTVLATAPTFPLLSPSLRMPPPAPHSLSLPSVIRSTTAQTQALSTAHRSTRRFQLAPVPIRCMSRHGVIKAQPVIPTSLLLSAGVSMRLLFRLFRPTSATSRASATGLLSLTPAPAPAPRLAAPASSARPR